MIAACKKGFPQVSCICWWLELDNENLTQRRKDAENAKGYEDNGQKI